jgi:hypothetical protein
MRNIHSAIINIAPERKSQFETELNNFTIEYLDTSEWLCDVNPNNCYIRISRQVVEILWAASYSYIMFYTKIVQGKKATIKEVITHPINGWLDGFEPSQRRPISFS